MKEIFHIGQSRPIEETDIYPVEHELQSERNTNKLSILWQQQKCKSAPSLSRALFKLYGAQILTWSAVVIALESGAKCVNYKIEAKES